MTRTTLVLGLLAGLLSARTASATLIDQGNGLIYDSVLNVTWLQDANLAGTSFSFVNASIWAQSLVYGGFSDWRLPSMDVNGDNIVADCSSATQAACQDNEYGYMFYHNLGGTLGSNLTGNQGPFTNIQSLYWSETLHTNTSSGWAFSFNNGGQINLPVNVVLIPWAVRNGSSASVPEAGSAFLLGVGLAVLELGRRRRRK